MRQLVVGALSIAYVRHHWVDPLRRLYHAVFVDVSPLLNAERDNFHEGYILRILRESRFDHLLFYADGIQPFFSDCFFVQVRNLGVKVLAFLADDDPEVWFGQNRPYDHRYDEIFSPSTRGVARRLAAGVHGVHYLPWGFNPAFFPELAPEEPDTDVIFVGTNLSHDADANLYCRDGRSRQQVLVDLYRICQRHGFIFRIYGFGWHRHPVLKDCYGGFPDQKALLERYRRTKLVFNPGFTADDDFSWQTKLRHFEVAGCGLCQIANENPELADLFQEDAEIVFYRDVPDLEAKLLRLLGDDQLRRRIGRNAARRAHGEHRIDQRLVKMIGPPPALPETAALAVRRIHNWQELDRLRQRLEQGTESFGAAVAVQLIAGQMELLAHEPALLPEGWERMEVDMWAVRSYGQLAALHGNHIQRKTQDIRGVLLPECVRMAALDAVTATLIGRQLLGVFSERIGFPLINYWVRPRALLQFLQHFLAQNLDWQRHFTICFTGRVVNDFRLTGGDASVVYEAPYLTRLRELLAQAAILRVKVLVYGARGEMADQAMLLLRDSPQPVIMGLVDRNLAGQSLGAWRVWGPEDLEQLDADWILVAAETSGPAIVRSLQERRLRAEVFPLYDLAAPQWRLYLP